MKDVDLRDFLAGCALAGGLEQGARDNFDSHYWHDSKIIANRAYDIADAMLRCRSLKSTAKPR